jgi:hypothetical protein
MSPCILASPLLAPIAAKHAADLFATGTTTTALLWAYLRYFFEIDQYRQLAAIFVLI